MSYLSRSVVLSWSWKFALDISTSLLSLASKISLISDSFRRRRSISDDCADESWDDPSAEISEPVLRWPGENETFVRNRKHFPSFCMYLSKHWMPKPPWPQHYFYIYQTTRTACHQPKPKIFIKTFLKLRSTNLRHVQSNPCKKLSVLIKSLLLELLREDLFDRELWVGNY